MEEKILSINIDMGMNYNGIYYASLEKSSEDKYDIKDKSAVCISLPKNSINYSKAGRRLKRHITAGYQREKLAKRLFDEIIDIKSFTEKHQEKLHGLFKNRGFTYFTISNEFEDADDLVIDFIEQKSVENKSDILLNLYTIENIEKSISHNASSDENLINYIDNVIKEIEYIKQPYEEYLQIKEKNKQKPFDREIYDYLNKLKKLFLEQKKEVTLGQKPRKTYFKDIEALIKQIDFVDSFSKDELYHIVCNISNLQLRCLHKYFNGKYDDNLDNKKLGEKLYKFYKSRHYRKDDKFESESKKELIPFILALKDDKDGLKFLKTADPFYTIPPMEDMNNRGGYKCNVLLIKEEFIDDDIKICLNSLYSKGIFIDHNGQVIKDIDYFKDEKTGNIDYEKAFRRFADYSLSMIDKTKTTPVAAGFLSESSHPRKVFTDNEINDEYFKSNYFKGYEKEYIKFRELLIKYYSEEKNILKGIYTEQKSIFRPCGCNAPLKNNLKGLLIKSLFRDIKCDFNDDDVKEFENQIYNTVYKGRSTIYSFLSKLAEQAKRDKNSFFANVEYFYSNNKCIKKDDMLFSFDELEKVINKTAEILFSMKKISEKEKDNLSVLNEDTLKNRVNIFKQLFDILDKKISGYYKTCKTHTEENEQRSQVFSNMGHAVYKRLLSRVSKPIDGMLDMHLDRLAYEIVKNIPFDISQFNKIEINVEENRFCFEEGLKEIKGGKAKKKKSNKSNEKPLCPYTGQEIVHGDYDHIIPRSSRLGIFNSEANLIYCSSEGNQAKKKDIQYGIDALNKEHLQQVFGTSTKEEIIKYISDNLNTIDEKSYTNFSNLNRHQQNAFRYALFLQAENVELFNKALNLVKQDKLKTITNGTQKRLISLIYEKALLKNNNLECSANVVESKFVRAVRNELSRKDNKLMKPENQNNHSHCIDASIVFYLSHSSAKSKSIQSKYVNNPNDVRPEYNYFEDVYLEESSIDLIEKKRKFITLDKSKHDMGSVKYFDDTIYSIYIKPYEYAKIDKGELKQIKILIESNLLYKNIKGKKFFITNIEDINKNDYLWVDKQKYFDLLFSLFHDGKVEELEKLKFIDEIIGSKTKKEIKQLIFKDGDLKKDFIDIKNASKPLKELCSRFKKEFKNINEDEREERYEKLCKEFFNPYNSKRLRKTKRIYSLDVEGQANYIVRRSKNTYQALRSKDIATPTYIVGNDIVNIEYYSKNAIPFKIKKLLNILKYKNVEKKQIYEKEIKDVSIISKEAKKYIEELTYTFSESGRVHVKVTLNKLAFKDIDFNNIIENAAYNIKDDSVKTLVDNYINNIDCPLFQCIGKPRTDGKQIKITKQSTDYITLEYPKQIDKEFKNLIKKLYETHSN